MNPAALRMRHRYGLIPGLFAPALHEVAGLQCGNIESFHKRDRAGILNRRREECERQMVGGKVTVWPAGPTAYGRPNTTTASIAVGLSPLIHKFDDELASCSTVQDPVQWVFKHGTGFASRSTTALRLDPGHPLRFVLVLSTPVRRRSNGLPRDDG